MAPAGEDGVVYSATYSNVPVYELNVRGNHVMRRRADDWINATHILKVADLDKPARTRVLEKEVQLDIHEKVQGGYGKYQGTWVPQDKAEVIARKYNVYDLLRPILVFKLAAGDKSPPPAPKHTTAASNKVKAAKAAPVRKAVTAQKPRAPVARREEDYERYDNISEQLHDDDSPDNSTIGSESIIGDEEFISSRKRKRAGPSNEYSRQDQEHRLWADSLLDYFMLHEGDSGYPGNQFPEVPPNVDVNRPIDNESHTALHWATAMGDVEVVKDLIHRGANVQARNIRGETPLIRAALFANCYDRGTWGKMVHMLQNTILVPDHHGGTIFHHIAYTAIGGTRAQRARNYLEVLLNKLKEMVKPSQFLEFLNMQDRGGDTAFHIAVRNSRRCTKAFQAHGLPSNIPNNNGETVDHYLQQKAKPRAGRSENFLQSSSPVQGDHLLSNTFSPSRFPPTSNMFLPANALKTSSSKTFNRSFTALVSTGITEFLQAGEAEMTDKENLLSDTQRALQRTESDIASTRHKILELTAAMEIEETESAILESKHQSLLNEAEKLEEQIQHRKLHKIVHSEEKSNATILAGNTHTLDLTAERMRKLELARLLHSQQEKRRAKTKEIVDALADAGMGAKGEQMKGIILQTLAVSRDNFVEDVDAMVEHMEIENVGEGGADLSIAMDIKAH